MVTSSEDGWVKVWQTKDGAIQRSYDHGIPVNDVVIHPNQGEVIACDRGGNVRIWDLGENKCTHQLIPEEDVSVSSVTVATDGTLLCAGNNSVSYAVVPSIIYDGLTLVFLGQRLRLAHGAKPRHHLTHTRNLLSSTYSIRHSGSSFPRCPSSCHLQRRS